MLDLLLSFRVEIAKVLLAAHSYSYAGLYLLPKTLILAGLRNIVAKCSKLRGGSARSDAIKCDQPNLVEMVEAVKVALMQQDLE